MPPRQTTLPAPMGDRPSRLKTVDAEAIRSRVTADIDEFLSQNYFPVDDEPDVDGPVRYFADMLCAGCGRLTGGYFITHCALCEGTSR